MDKIGNAAFNQVANCVDKVAQIAPEPVEIPDHERAITAQRVQEGVLSGALLEPAPRNILVDIVGINADRDQRIATETMVLTAIRFEHVNIADLRCRVYVISIRSAC